jgi:translocation and assembly module TamB
VIRRRIAILFLPALLILLAAGVFAWLLHSEPGARWIMGRVVAAVPGQLDFERVTGDLQSGLRIVGPAYRDEGISLTADTLELRLDLGFWPPAITVHELRTGSLEIRSGTTTTSAGESSPADWLPALTLPVPVEFRQVRGDRIAWYGGPAEPPLELRDLSLAAYWYRSLELRRVEVISGVSRWQADLELDLQMPHALELGLRGSIEAPEAAGLGQPVEFEVAGSGDLNRSRWNLQAVNPGLTIAGELRDLLGTPAWDLQLEAHQLQWPLEADEPDLLLSQVVASSYGTAAEYGLEVEAAVAGAAFPTLQGKLVGSGDSTGLEIQVMHLDGEAARLEGSGRIDWQSTLRAGAAVDVVRFDPGFWLPEWGEAEPARGRLGLAWTDQRIDFELLELEAPGTFGALQGSGAVDLASGIVSADLEWRNLAWPPGAAEPLVRSEHGGAILAGRLDEWTVSGELDLSGPDFPPGRLQVQGGGNADSLHLVIPQGAVLGGGLAGELDVTWAPEVQWALSARVSNVATAPVAPDFPGRLSGDVAVRGRSDPVVLDIEIRELSGEIRERQVRARGKLALAAGKVDARNLLIRSGQSELTLDGRLDAPDGLAFTAQIASLADFADGAAGSFKGSGAVSVNAARPFLSLQGQGQNLVWGDSAIESLRVSTAPEQGGSQRFELLGIDLGETRIERLTAMTGGAKPLEHVEVEAELTDSRVELRLDGRINDWSALLEGGWTGQLQALRLDGGSLGYFELEEPAALQANGTALVLAPACFSGSREGHLCVESTWRLQGERALVASLEDVSPNLAMSLAGSDLAFTQRLSGIAEWRQQPRSQAAARVDLQISAGDVTERGEDEVIIRTGPGLFGFQVANGRLYAGNLDIPVPGSGGIDTDFSVPDMSAGLESSVQGRIQVNLASIEPLLRLIPGMEGSSGPVTAEMNFSGSLADPQLTGHASLVRGTLSHFASGLLLEDIRLAGAVYQYDQTELSGTFRAGSGQGSIRAVVNFDDILQPELLLEIQGDDLTLVNVPDLNVTADPDLRLVWRQGAARLSGRIAVPTARLSPRYLPTSGASESLDVVIVAGEDPLAREQQDAAIDWQLYGELELELGDDVELQLERATAQLRGKTKFKWDGQLVPLADGGLSLGGEIYAYGQLLKVTEGRINFSNRPADNPFLNIRAEREIYGNSQITRAGVLVTGSLKQPVLEPYSVPMTTQERALTLLITGNDFNPDQGVGSVEVGMYVAPKLYISYGIGLFDDQSIVSARYDLGKGFGIKTTSGQRETGADISYTIER